jgi:hypothetical protein
VDAGLRQALWLVVFFAKPHIGVTPVTDGCDVALLEFAVDFCNRTNAEGLA